MDRQITPFTFKVIYGYWPPELNSQKRHKRIGAKAAPFPLMSLVPELHLIVAENLNPFDRLALRLINHHFFRLIPPVHLSAKDLCLAQAQLYKRRGPDSQAVPGTTIKNDTFPYLACMSCMRLRLSTSFADDQTRWSPVLKVPRRLTKATIVKSYSLLYRFCIDCGIDNNKPGFHQGQIIKVNQEEFVICNFCSGLGRNVEDGSRRSAAGLCEACWITLEMTRSGKADGKEEEEKTEEYGGSVQGSERRRCSHSRPLRAE